MPDIDKKTTKWDSVFVHTAEPKGEVASTRCSKVLSILMFTTTSQIISLGGASGGADRYELSEDRYMQIFLALDRFFMG